MNNAISPWILEAGRDFHAQPAYRLSGNFSSVKYSKKEMRPTADDPFPIKDPTSVLSKVKA